MTWHFEEIGALAKHAATWRELATTQSSHPFLDIDLVGCAARHFGANLTLGRYEQDGSVRAFIVLQHGSSWSRATFAPAQLPYTLFLAAPQVDLARCFAALFQALGGTTLMVTLLHFDARYAPLDATTSQRARHSPYAQTISIEGHGGFDTYAASRSKKLRDNMKRYQKRLNAAFGSVELRVLTAAGDMAGVVRQHGELEAKGWKGREGSAVSQQAHQVDFYTEALELFARNGGAVAFQLVCDGEVIASRFGIVANGVYVFLKTAYAEQHRNLAPGRVLQWLAVGHVLDHVRPSAIEFYTKADVDQLQWGTSSRMIEHIELARSPLVAAGLGLLRAARNSLRRSKTNAPEPAPAPAAE